MNKRGVRALAGTVGMVALVLAGCLPDEQVIAVPGAPVPQGMPQAQLALPNPVPREKPPAAPPIELVVTGCSVGPQGQADRDCDPGALNPDVTQATIGTTICVPGWTKTVRPPTSYTSPLRNVEMLLYYPPGTPTTAVRYDHLYPLELGGHPSDVANLWPQPVEASYRKNTHGGRLKDQVCGGAITLEAAQREILNTWTH